MCVCVSRENRWKKRGIAVMPTKFGISFGAIFLNQVFDLIEKSVHAFVLIDKKFDLSQFHSNFI